MMGNSLTITVFGGSGFLRSHLCDQLSETGHKVCIFDCVESPWLHSDQEMILGDLLDEPTLFEAVEGCNAVYNFAAIADIDEALNKSVETIRVNIYGNAFALEACRIAGDRRYIYASTVYVYGREGGFCRCSKQAADHMSKSINDPTD